MLDKSPDNRFPKTTSIQATMQRSYIIIISLMLLAPIISLFFSLYQTFVYDRMITNVSRTNRLIQIVKTEIANEVWDIVAGNITFSEGNQFQILDGISSRLEEIYTHTQVSENRQMLQVAERTVGTLEQYVNRLGLQIQNEFLVDENEVVLEQIRGVADLLSDILQDFIVLEIEAAAVTNESVKKIAVVLTLIQIFILLVVMIFSIFTQKSVIRNINSPISDLVDLSSQIAEGNLSARAAPPHVFELDHLTENLNFMAARIDELMKANIEEQKNLQKSEMKALQAQITPHFLYNTLDSIVWLAEGKQNEQVVAVTRSFSDFFRATLNRGKEWTSVEGEIAHASNYLQIQKVRYRDILDFRIEVEEEINNAFILKILLQPLVENALYHGIKNKRGKGMIIVKGWREEDFLFFSVEDNGIGITPERLDDLRIQINYKSGSEGKMDVYGLYNVNKRLALYYNNRASLKIESVYKEGTTVTFSVPEVNHV